MHGQQRVNSSAKQNILLLLLLPSSSLFLLRVLLSLHVITDTQPRTPTAKRLRHSLNLDVHVVVDEEDTSVP